jgi:hypothetical protein
MSTIKVDTLVAADGSSAVTLTKQQAAKAWSNVSNASVIQGSFNISSVDDAGSGNYDLNWTNNFSDTDYSHVGADGNFGHCNTEPQSLSTGEANVYSYNSSHSLADSAISTVANGDLA